MSYTPLTMSVLVTRSENSGIVVSMPSTTVGSTLLGSGTGGVYYATTHNWSQPATAKTTQNSDAALDAVAGAWSEPAPKTASATADSSPIVRSATAKPAEVDRYATPATALAPVVATKGEVAKNDAAKKETAKEPAKAAADKPKKNEPLIAKPDDKAIAKSPTPAETKKTEEKKSDKASEPRMPTLAALPPEPMIARGQEPKVDAPPAALPASDMSADISKAFDAAPEERRDDGHRTKSDQRARPTNEHRSIGRRAKQAFGSNTPLPPPGDRYSGGSPATPQNAAVPKQMAADPFGAAPLAAAPPSTNMKNDRLAPLPNTPSDINAPLRELQPPSDTIRPIDQNPAPSRTANRDISSKNRMPQAAPFGGSPSAKRKSLFAASRRQPVHDERNASPTATRATALANLVKKRSKARSNRRSSFRSSRPAKSKSASRPSLSCRSATSAARPLKTSSIRDEVPQGTQAGQHDRRQRTTDGSQLAVGARQTIAGRRSHRRNAAHADRRRRNRQRGHGDRIPPRLP